MEYVHVKEGWRYKSRYGVGPTGPEWLLVMAGVSERHWTEQVRTSAARPGAAPTPRAAQQTASTFVTFLFAGRESPAEKAFRLLEPGLFLVLLDSVQLNQGSTEFFHSKQSHAQAAPRVSYALMFATASEAMAAGTARARASIPRPSSA